MINKRITSIIAVTSILIFTSYFTFRTPVVRSIINNRIKSYNNKNKYNIHIGKISFKGISEINIKDFVVINIEKDTILHASLIRKSLLLKDILKLTIHPEKIYIHGLDVNIKLSQKNTSPLDANHQKRERISLMDTMTYNVNELMPDIKGKELNKKLEYISNILFSFSGSGISISDLNLLFNVNGDNYRIEVDNFNLLKTKNSMEIDIINSGTKQSFLIDFNTGKYKIYITVTPGNDTEYIHLLKDITGTELKFNRVKLVLYRPYREKKHYSFHGSFEFKDLWFFNKIISDTVIIFDEFIFSYLFNMGEDFIELDSLSSFVSINNFIFNPYFYYKKDKYADLIISIKKHDFPAQKLLQALPKGSFNTIRDIQTTGNLSYSLLFDMNSKKPDSLKFESSLKKHNFRIRKFGNVNFMEINKPFEYTIRRNGFNIKKILISPENKGFVPFKKIPKKLISAVLTSEDGQFFKHKGFAPESFRLAIARNFKRRRFAHGGSTITMQLVKNIFLTSQKNVTRKLEEMFIVWLIENNRLVSKERLLEIYFNVIEWGPGVYGIKDAARFYFKKSYKKLNLKEILFLTIIIPRPRYFKSFFDKKNKGVLRPYREHCFYDIAKKMLRRGHISESELSRLKPHITFRGPADTLFAGYY